VSEFEDLQRRHTKRTKSVPVCFDQALLEELEGARKRLQKYESDGMLDDSVKQDLGEDVAKLQAKAKDATITIVFQAVGRRRWREMVSDHPPTDEQKAEDPDAEFDPETFLAAAMADSCAGTRQVDAPKDQPLRMKLSRAQFQWIIDEFTFGDVDRIWAACLEANLLDTSPLGGTASHRRGVTRSTQPQS
jgi:hypothetical protein